jgi:FMN-dependent oxidoreductase (nitrilotriacetate monooxygenase family)
MTDKRFHLAIFTSFSNPAWTDTYAGADAVSDWASGQYYIDMVRDLERACFDYVIFEDSLMVSDIYGGTSELDLKHGLHAPKHDPVALTALLTGATKHIGLVPTMSTSFYPPFMLARMLSTLDSMSGGRVGWNIVTSSENRSAQNFGMDELLEHDQRYEMADEFIDLVSQLWESWQEGALVADRESGTYIDYTKVNPIHFTGKYFRSRGPLNTLRSPQGRPVFSQAGSSPRGREFAAKHAETIIAIAPGRDAMRDFAKDIHDRMALHGRDPSSAKILWVVAPQLGETDAVARFRAEEAHQNAMTDLVVQKTLGHMAALTERDFSTFDLDAPVPQLPTNGHRGMLTDWYRMSEGKALREAAADWTINCVPLVGSPDTVADEMGDVIADAGGDGYLIWRGGPVTRQYTGELTEGLAPALQRKGYMRSEYSYSTFRENLLEF